LVDELVAAKKARLVGAGVCPSREGVSIRRVHERRARRHEQRRPHSERRRPRVAVTARVRRL
jgi:hypothetical protein